MELNNNPLDGIFNDNRPAWVDHWVAEFHVARETQRQCAAKIQELCGVSADVAMDYLNDGNESGAEFLARVDGDCDDPDQALRLFRAGMLTPATNSGEIYAEFNEEPSGGAVVGVIVALALLSFLTVCLFVLPGLL